jgi:nucleoside-diphosphate-sugar epimerase
VELDGARVLVTGANGFVGGRVCRRLAAGGAQVFALVRRGGASGLDRSDGIAELVGDLTDEDDARRAVDGVGAVVHCAATSGDDLEAVRHVNTNGTRVVAREALAAGVSRCVHSSTASVYDRERRGDLVDETSPMTSEGDPYSVTKAEAEREVAAASDHGLSVTVLRPPAVLGWGPTSTWGEELPEAIAAGRLPFTPHPASRHAWVHVDDLADAVAIALSDDRAVGRTYNVVGGQGTWRGYVDAVCDVIGYDGPDPLEGADGPAWTGRYDASRIRDELGFEPRRSFEDGIAETSEHWSR